MSDFLMSDLGWLIYWWLILIGRKRKLFLIFDFERWLQGKADFKKSFNKTQASSSMI